MSRTRTLLAQIAPRVSPLVLLAFLSACQSTPQVSVAWDKLPDYSSEAARETTIYISWRDAAGSPFDFIEQELREAATARGMKVVEDQQQASFVCCGSLRFFAQNDAKDAAKAVVEAAGPVAGGYKSWEIEGQGVAMDVRPVEAVRIDAAKNGIASGLQSAEWDLLIDFAIGERKSATEAEFVRREARLVAYVTGRGLERTEAFQALENEVRSEIAEVLPRSRSTSASAPKP